MSNGTHLTKYEKEYLKQLILECDVQRFNYQESHAYIRARLGKEISDSTIDKAKQRIKCNLESRVNHLRKHKTAFLEQLFKRIAEIEKYQRELWSTTLLHNEEPYLRLNCIKELHQLSITLANLYEVLPAFIGTSLASDGSNNIPIYNTQDKREPQTI